ncbi:lytic polysaccharide monooxygenase [Zopfia rhizophila CBS 207.26]|uniref:Lytic polysaccharide monooxygenase n=1 Tax=Zopfia rhizophila CBS 207.26 TaxID=1314779 RepID=A0A6A6EKM0_9PEZI|nr:lytic polysaccharide monooxygenase [Zopfia rhizophila CBS 207.26]
MSPRTAIVALATLLASSANAHMIMAKPVPFSVDKIDNSPITAAQYPCKSQNGFTVSTMNSMKVGEEQQLTFKGSARHGGGSCQLAVTTDETPSANSKFKVIMSMEGGCPKTNPEEAFTFKLPDSVPNGKMTFAWTWFSRLSGQPELYMNCAPIEVTGGASDSSKFDALPDLFVANIGQGCTTPANKNTKFPNPGESVLTDNAEASADAPTGNCGTSAGGGGSPAPSSGNGGGAPASSAAAGAPSSAAGGKPATSAAVAPSAAPSNPGGVFAPGASSAAGGQPAQSTLTTLVTITGTPVSPVQPTSAPAAGTGTPASPSAPSSGGGAGTCSQNGAIVCNGSDQFGICNNGQVVWQQVAAGTTCSNGTIQKRAYNRQLRGRVARPRVVPGQDFTPDN